MTKTTRKGALEKGILRLLDEAKESPLSLKAILQILSGHGRLFILILLSLPFCQPIQIPGLSIPFGLAIAFIGLRMTFGKQIWLPQKLLAKKVATRTLKKTCERALAVIRALKPWLHPRLSWLTHSDWVKKGNGLLFLLLGLFLALPLPIPLSNMTAAWSIFLIALGMVEDDGLVILLGYLAALVTFGFFIATALTIKSLF